MVPSNNAKRNGAAVPNTPSYYTHVTWASPPWHALTADGYGYSPDGPLCSQEAAMRLGKNVWVDGSFRDSAW